LPDSIARATAALDAFDATETERFGHGVGTAD